MKTLLSWIKKKYKLLILVVTFIVTTFFSIFIYIKRKNKDNSLGIIDFISSELQALIVKKENVSKEHEKNLENIKKEKEVLDKEKENIKKQKENATSKIEKATDSELDKIIKERNL